MKFKLLVLFSVLCLFAVPGMAQIQFEIPINITDGATAVSCTIGVHPNGSMDSFVAGLDRYMPPAGPEGTFDARLLYDDDSYFTKIFDNTLLEKQISIQSRRGAGQNPITITWDKDALPKQFNFTIHTLFQPAVNMKATDTFNPLMMNGTALNATITMTPTGVVPAGNTDENNFEDKKVAIQFTTPNDDDIKFLIVLQEDDPGGDPPAPVENIAPQSWKVEVTEGTVTGTYCIEFDLTGIPGIFNFATLSVLKRQNDNGPTAWENVADMPGVTVEYDDPNIKVCGLTSFSEFTIGGEADNPLPVELTGFTASVDRFTVTLNWETASEIENYGFSVKRQTADGNWEEIGFVEGHGTVNTPNSYSFADEVGTAGRYSYRLKQIDLDGTYEYFGPVEVIVGESEAKFYLSDNYPNPANPTTQIEFVLEEPGYTTLTVYNVLGQQVATLVNNELTAGQIHRVTFDGSHLSSGIYLYVLRSGNNTEVKKLLLMK